MPISLSGSLNLSGSLTTTGTITATTLVVQTITSSISSITGSTNFGSLSSDTHKFTGSLNVTGAFYVTTGSVGIGTSTPDIFGRGYTGTTVGVSAATGDTGLEINGGTSSGAYIDLGTAGTRNMGLISTTTESQIISLSTIPLVFKTNSVTRLTIASTGAATFSSSVTAGGAITTSTSVANVALDITNTDTVNGFGAFIQGGGTAANRYSLRVKNGAGTTVFDVLATGAATFSSGIAIGNATATTGGIQFPATAVAIADANNLDDYEEGTWTPVIVGGTTAGTGTYTQQIGKYTKVGRVVHIYFALAWSAHTGTGKTIVTGFPFTNASGGQNPFSVFTYGETMTAGNVPNGGLMSNGATQWEHWQVPTGGGTTSGIPIYNGAGEIQLSGTYIA